MVGASARSRKKPRWTCIFAPYGCPARSVSAAGWKRHVLSKHLQTSVYRCDVPSCTRVYDRLDVFRRHLSRDHGSSLSRETKDRVPWRQIRERCWSQVREGPRLSSCGYCSSTFEGPDCWIRRERHLNSCREHRIRPGTKADLHLQEWALREGVLTRASNGAISRANPHRPLHVPGASARKPISTPNSSRRAPVEPDSGPSIPEPPARRLLRRFVWVCVSARSRFSKIVGATVLTSLRNCNYRLEVDVDDQDRAAVDKLRNLSIICGRQNTRNTSNERPGTISVLSCQDLDGHIQAHGRIFTSPPSHGWS